MRCAKLNPKESEIKITDLPLNLRKVGNCPIESIEICCLKEACDKLGLNTYATYVSVYKCIKRRVNLIT